MRRSIALMAFCAGSGAVLGCHHDATGPTYDPVIPTAWDAAVTNPFFPLTPGTRYVYEGDTDQGHEVDSIEVLHETRVIQGVVATIVHDRVFVDDVLAEDTFDWYAQSADGDVWYLGEDTKELDEHGQVVTTAGSWEWGTVGALPGIIMWNDPAAHVGEAYRQEFLKGDAEDWGKVVAVDQSVAVTAGNFTGCLRTEDWSDLEPGVREAKSYCLDIGDVLEELVRGGQERMELVSVTPS